MYQRLWAEIDLKCIRKNYLSIKAQTENAHSKVMQAENTHNKITQNKNDKDEAIKICAIVKADGYGHGAVAVSKELVKAGVDWLAVAICDEGQQLREAGIESPVLILGYTPEWQFEQILCNDLTKTIYDLETAKCLSSHAQRLHKKASVHIKVDTGMNRLGFQPDHIKEILEVARLGGLEVTGIFTHFAYAEDADKGFTVFQYESFMDCVRSLEKEGLFIPLKHASNSNAILNHHFGPELNMVRPGLILYGYSDSDLDLSRLRPGMKPEPALSLKTVVSQIKELPANTSIGYRRSYTTTKNTRIATLPVGYADGYPRALSNKGRVLINGNECPIVGLVCMDMMMVDVTDLEVKTNDEVQLIGKSKEKEISANELAELTNTINYEILCSIGKRVPRIYIE